MIGEKKSSAVLRGFVLNFSNDLQHGTGVQLRATRLKRDRSGTDLERSIHRKHSSVAMECP
jgi:hypothetical protein